MKILYFAWLRERIGLSEEDVDIPPEVTTISALTDFLSARSPAHTRAFADRRAIKTALDQRFVPPDTLLEGAREIAFFPPFTGG
ncbi:MULTISPECIES: molybdopterin converting factor subunit 1 [Acidiphilium]|jgi:molybdopterin synthase sulfur carrier subunit|uniref:Molybdopterin synthase subunit MoaD n=2 Tax=Acidiphilium TaxID=522 RepID=A5FZJ8_ACICJ|nr:MULTISPECIES: molybdopterin converting factor subunit 1 [Acidiphilium]MBU6357710.1 molybdopterin converting factor subunit 1 [Rhodospirillales bacterium]ABQ31030.1 molybdopterin synthase subunit MoaD [Acidiphilium cryptum JF-5]EGO93499.1 Molybdopterin converting factor, subunit 1 [Acidiphilium sp. PM]KDM67362.1 molybdopterin converting factor, subunit 1 [Acidiphilium sp. JA12-A1]MDE2326925.1 molybdopterin converting factor subunit 1 [Rhodospirillales bacterium]